MTRGENTQADDFYSQMQSMIMETRDSTIRTEQIVKQLTAKLESHDRVMDVHEKKLGALEIQHAVNEDRSEQRRYRINLMLGILAIPGIGYVIEKLFEWTGHKP